MKQQLNRIVCLGMAALMIHVTVMAGNPLRKGTYVPLALLDEVRSVKDAPDPVVVVNMDILDDNDRLIIEAGTPVECATTIKHNRRIGRPGTITIQPLSTTAVDGTRVALDVRPLTAEGKNRKGSVGAAAGSMTFLFGCTSLLLLLIKGGKATIPGRTVIRHSYTTYDVQIAE